MIELFDKKNMKLLSSSFFKLFIYGLVAIILFTISYNFVATPVSQNKQNITALPLSNFRILRMIVLTPFIEEVIFRLGIQNLFKRISKSNLVAILFTSLIFAYIHNDTIFLPYLFNSIVYGFLYVKSGNSFKMPFLLHMSNNLISYLL